MSNDRPLRLLVFDRTCRGPRLTPGLTAAWRTGSRLYRTLGRLDGAFAAPDWAAGLDWLASYQQPRPIAEIQFWGHGKWGCALLAGEAIDRRALRPGHEHHARLEAVRARLVPLAQHQSEALWWFRTCETFGACAGHDFARAWTDFFGCRCAGHSYVIGFYQSGLHSLAAGQEPCWPRNEGLLQGTPESPLLARRSRPWAPNTINCLCGRVPSGY